MRLAGLRICSLRPPDLSFDNNGDGDPLSSTSGPEQGLAKEPVSVLAQVAHQRVRVSFPPFDPELNFSLSQATEGPYPSNNPYVT
jgi:hypothetical protein